MFGRSGGNCNEKNSCRHITIATKSAKREVFRFMLGGGVGKKCLMGCGNQGLLLYLVKG